MNHRDMLVAAVALAFSAAVVTAVSGVDGLVGKAAHHEQNQNYPAVVDDQGLACPDEPEWQDRPSLDNVYAWYVYGDCSGYYGPIDVEYITMPDEVDDGQ